MTAPAASPRGRNLALLAALLGWMFDGLEMGLFPLVARPALRELLGSGIGEDIVGKWFAVITAGFLVGAATGGVLFGWLGDRIGRVRAMTISVFVYAGCSGMCAAAQTPWELAGLRFAGALGMGGEWALGVALVMELWPDRGRGWLAGWIGAFGNLGYAVVGAVAYALTQFGSDLPGHLVDMGLPAHWASSLTANGNWRLLMIFGAIPAVLTLFIRLLVPESEKWLREKEAGSASKWSARDLLGVLIGAAAAAGILYLWAEDFSYPIRIVGTVIGVAIVTVGYLYPVRGYLSRAGTTPKENRQTIGRMLLAAGLSGVPLLATWGGVMWVYNFVDDLTKGSVPEARPVTMVASAVGAAFGCVVAAVFGERLGRRPVYIVMCLSSMVVMFAFFRLNTHYGWEFVASAALLGAVSASFYGWLPLYLPELFRTGMRATGQGFGFNFGRIIAAVGALQTGALLKAFDNNYGEACSVAAGVYLFGLVLICFAPETKGKPLPE
jgi:MFS transporter, SHS family, sialic acid transporter